MNAPTMIIGATSGIGAAVAQELAKRRGDLILAARDMQALASVASDLHLRYGVSVEKLRFEALDFESHERLVEDAIALGSGRIRGVVVCHGMMADQAEAESNFCLAKEMLDVNLTSCISILNRFANHFESARSGFICGVSSVAGDRGRQSNYLYGASKAGFSVYLQGLRNRMHRFSVPVITIKPGFVDTAMTWGKVKPNSPLTARPDKAARQIVSAINRKQNVVYTLHIWRWVMLVIKLIPEWLFKRMSL